MFCIVEHLIGFRGFEKFKLQRLPLLWEKKEIWLKIIAREEEVTLRTMLMDHATFFIYGIPFINPITVPYAVSLSWLNKLPHQHLSHKINIS